MREFRMPRLALDDEEMVLASWSVAEGGAVAEGDPVLEVETSKAVMEVESPGDGVLAVRVRAPGEAVAVGDLLALIADPGETYDAEALRDRSPKPAAGAPDRPEPAPSPVGAPVPSSAPPAPDSAVPRRSTVPERPDPLVPHGFLAGLPAGPRRAPEPARARPPEPRPESRPESRPVKEKLSPHRGAVARLMTASAGIPQFSVHRELEIASAEELVRRLRAVGIRATLTDVVLKATAYALLRNRRFNALLVGDHIERFDTVSIGVATDGPAGVLAPVVHGVERLDWAALAAERSRVVLGAREGRLRPEDLTGGTFSVSNVGPLGGDAVVPMVTPPQIGILGLGRARTAGDRRVLTAVVVADHRAVDGADAARLLAGLGEALGDADRLTLAGPDVEDLP
ncbi:2-oxo acid dehydrogenase subunit E2 [Actinomadura sp. B10D3]|uniref:2-oxo acid dehydrogenase subunit E2 n=1 Tax=Actinomadura sp. B10D3 TaxID=3153557 RepID=UPI00325E08DB